MGNTLRRLSSCQNYQTQQSPPADLPGTVTDFLAHKCRPGWTLTPSHGYTYLFTIVDRLSRWAEAFPLVESSVVPTDISFDRDAQFTLYLWDAMANGLGTTLQHTTAYHPKSNCLVEFFHRNLKEALKTSLGTPGWFQTLSWVLLGIRTASKEDLGCTMAEMVYGMSLFIPRDFIPSPIQDPDHRAAVREIREHAAQLVPIPTTKHGNPKSSFSLNLKKTKFVFIRKDKHSSPLSRPYEGPFEVLEPGEKFVKVARHGKIETISVDRLKTTHLDITASSSQTGKSSTTSASGSTPEPPRTQPYTTR